MADKKPITFVLSDESINSYGSRILTSGIDISLFKANPVMLYNHHRSWRGDQSEILPIGRWENIRIEGSQLLADAHFDQQDPFAQGIEAKALQGILNMASGCFEIIATSEEKSVLIQGQTRPTVIKSLIMEASIVDIGSNRHALRLSDQFGGPIDLSSDDNHLLPLLTKTIDNEMKLSDVTMALGREDLQEESQVLRALTDQTTELASLRSEIERYRNAEAQRLLDERNNTITLAINERKITEAQRPEYEKLWDANAEATKTVLASLRGAEKPKTEIVELRGSALARRKAEVKQNLR